MVAASLNTGNNLRPPFFSSTSGETDEQRHPINALLGDEEKAGVFSGAVRGLALVGGRWWWGAVACSLSAAVLPVALAQSSADCVFQSPLLPSCRAGGHLGPPGKPVQPGRRLARREHNDPSAGARRRGGRRIPREEKFGAACKLLCAGSDIECYERDFVLCWTSFPP